MPAAPVKTTQKTLCPFGCEPKDVTDLGYCRHLVGFTDDRKRLETVQKVKHGNREVECVRPSKETVQATDEIVEMVNGTHRVYRSTVPPKAAPLG